MKKIRNDRRTIAREDQNEMTINHDRSDIALYPNTTPF